MIHMTHSAIDAEVMLAELGPGPACGAIVTFAGVVRPDRDDSGGELLALVYEAYEPMAERELADCREAALAQFDIEGVAIVHRLGRLEIGEASILIAVTSAHRAAAFDAARFCIDRIKRRAPIWKQEVYERLSRWVHPELDPFEIEDAAT